MMVRSPFRRNHLWLVADHRFLGFRLAKWWIRVKGIETMTFSDRERRSLRIGSWIILAKRV